LFQEVRRVQPRRVAFSSITAQSESGNRDYYHGGSPVVSPKGARYAMQVMPATARDPGYGVAPARGNSPDEYNRVGRDYLEALHRKYGDPAKMWAAYNAGPGRLEKAMRRFGQDWLRGMPRETQEYVARNLRALGG
jgi:soluble lytic murein transglycosylase